MQLALEKSPHELIGLRVSLLSGRCCHDVCQRWESRHVVLRIRCPFSLGMFGTGSERTGSKCNSQCCYKLQSSAMVQGTQGGKTNGQGRETNKKHWRTAPKKRAVIRSVSIYANPFKNAPPKLWDRVDFSPPPRCIAGFVSCRLSEKLEDIILPGSHVPL